MNEQLQKLSAKERLKLLLEYLKNKDSYSPEERASIEELWKDDG